MDIETLLKEASAEPEREQPHRNDKYKPVIHQLAEKNFTTVQIYEWFKAKGITIGNGYISRVRRIHLKSIGEDDDESETLQPVANTGEAEYAAPPVDQTRPENSPPNAMEAMAASVVATRSR
jgi:hypothetical protein